MERTKCGKVGNPSYREIACRFQRTIAQTHRLDWAADVLERAFQLVDESEVALWKGPPDTNAASASAADCGESLVSRIPKCIRHHSLP